MAIRTLFMDIGGVVLCPDSGFWEELTRDYGVPDDAEQQFYSDTGPWSACRVGQMTYEESLVTMADMFHVDLNVITRLRQGREWILNRPMVDWLRSMKQRGYEIIVISNADTSLEDRLDAFNIADLFDQVVNSARVKVGKPDRFIYQVALGLTASRPDECLFIDDKERNMPEANALGIQTLVYTGMPAFLDAIQDLIEPAS